MMAGKVPGGAKGGPFEDELPLDLGGPLPWLETDDDGERERGGGRMIAALVAMVLIGGLAGGGFLYFRHRQQVDAMAVAGGVIKAPPGPYKLRPTDPGGSIAAGTGDLTFPVAEGKNPRAPVATGAGAIDATAPEPAASGAAGVGVQLGAYGSKDEADQAWSGLATRFPVLSGLRHRVIEAPGDLGTVFALQAVTANPAGAATLCAQLRDGGLKCQVKE